MPSIPYVSAAAFKAHPTYLDLDDLRSGSTSDADQTAELVNLLLMASDWADNRAGQNLGAHTVVQNTRARFDRCGNLRLHPNNTPVLAVSSIAYGWSPASLTTVTSPSTWVEDGRVVIAALAGGGAWSGSLQFGSPASGGEVFVQLTYQAGWVATQLTAGATAGAPTLTVADPAGILPGQTYRIWEPGYEEDVTVSPSWVPPAVAVPTVPVSVTLAAPTAFAHASGHDFSGMPSDMRLAVTNYAVSALMRPDTAREDSYPDTSLSSGTRQTDPRQDGSGLVAEAERILSRYQRVR
ncbi:hypothetical protein ACH4UM_19050 [Streptomyces sp. NPDC020801]|uniref:hypothetical protein n=1 Tax=Streptomyces sp. NPDC020801 TaxID=3365093 RepID=UPI0037AD43D3